MVYEESCDNSDGSNNGRSGHLSIDSRELARSLGTPTSAASRYARTIITSAIFAVCVSSFAGNYVQHLQYQRIAAQKQKIESVATGSQVTSMKHIQRQFDQKIIEMDTDEKLFREAVIAAKRRLGANQ